MGAVLIHRLRFTVLPSPPSHESIEMHGWMRIGTMHDWRSVLRQSANGLQRNPSAYGKESFPRPLRTPVWIATGTILVSKRNCCCLFGVRCVEGSGMANSHVKRNDNSIVKSLLSDSVHRKAKISKRKWFAPHEEYFINVRRVANESWSFSQNVLKTCSS